MASARSEPGVPSSTPASGQLDFYEAMADFRTMFPKLDPDVIEAVLRANNGVVESTIDHLLKLNEGSEETSTSASEQPSGDLLPPSYDAATATERQAQKAIEAGVRDRPSDPPRPQRQPPAHRSPQAAQPVPPPPPSVEEGATGGYRNWKPPLLGALPEDFLRLTTAGGRSGSRGTGGRCRNCGRHHHHHRHHHRHASARRPQQQSVPTASAGATTIGASGGAANATGLLAAKSNSLPSGGVSDMDTVEGLLQRRLMENEMKRRSSASNGPGIDADLQQCLDDERMAIMLQNEEFLRMLRRDTEFMRALHSDRTSNVPTVPAGNGEMEDRGRLAGEFHHPQTSEFVGAASLERTHPLSDPKDENEELRRQLKHMGKSSKKKFADLAKRFFTVRYKKKQPSIPPPDGNVERSSQPRFYKTDLPTESTMNLLDDDEADEECRHLRQREESERSRREPISFEPLPGTLSALPSYRTVQRPMYHPDCVSTFHDDHKDMV